MRGRSLRQTLVNEGENILWDWKLIPAQFDFLTALDTYTLFSGGFGCGKTSVLCAKVILLLTAIPNNLGFLGRLDGKALRASTMQTLAEMLPDQYLAQHNDQKGFIKLLPEYGGSKLVYGDFKDINDFKNMPLGFFAIDQAEETPQEVWDFLVGRIRRKNPIISNGKRQYYVIGQCPKRDWNRHYALHGDNKCRFCGAELPRFRQTKLKGENERPWDLICYKNYGFGVANPEGPSHWLFKYFPGLPGIHNISGPGLPDYRAFNATAYDAANAGFVTDKYVHDMEIKYADNQVMADRYLLGTWIEAEGLVYPAWSREAHITSSQSLRWNGDALLPDDLYAYEYIDHGLTAPTAVGWVIIEPCTCGCERDNYWIVDEHYAGGRAVSFHAAIIKNKRLQLARPIAATYLDHQAFSKTLMRRTSETTGMPSGIGPKEHELFSVAEEYMDNGIYPVPNQKDWNTGYNRISELLALDPHHIHPITGVAGAPHLFVLDRCRWFINEIESYKWKKIKGVSEFREEPADGNDHHMDGLNGFVASRPVHQVVPQPETDKERWVRELDEADFGKITFMGA